MFKNISEKIKGFSKFLFVFIVICGFAGGIVYSIEIASIKDIITAMITFVVIFIGSIVGGLFISLLYCGFGELIRQVTIIAENTGKTSQKGNETGKGSNRVIVSENVADSSFEFPQKDV